MTNETKETLLITASLTGMALVGLFSGMLAGYNIAKDRNSVEPSVVMVPQQAYNGGAGTSTYQDVRDFRLWVNDSARDQNTWAVTNHEPTATWDANFNFDKQTIDTTKARSYDTILTQNLEDTWTTITGTQFSTMSSSYYFLGVTFSNTAENIFLHGTEYGARTYVVPMVVQDYGVPQVALWVYFHTDGTRLAYTNQNATSCTAVSMDYIANYTGSVTIALAIPSGAMGTTPTLNMVSVERTTGPVVSPPKTATIQGSGLFYNRNSDFKVRGTHTYQDVIDAYENGHEEGLKEAYETIDGTTGVFGILGNAFNSVAGFLNIKVFGFMTIGSFIAVPIVVALVVAIFKILRG